jgi:hypothetical protein
MALKDKLIKPQLAGPAARPLRAAALLAGGCGLALLALYLAFPDKVYVFDGIMFAAVIERGIDEWRTELFNRRHLLFNPLLMGLRDALSLLRLQVQGYPLIQRVNACLGVLGIGLFFRLIRRLTADSALAALAAAMLALSSSYWTRATEGQVYMAMTVGAISVNLAAVWLLQEGSERAAWALSGAFAAAVLVHAATVCLAPVAAAALWLSPGRRGFRRLAWAGAAAGAAVAVPYLAAFRLLDLSSLFAFFLKATEFYGPAGSSSWGGIVKHFFTGGGLSLGRRLALVLQLLSSSLVASPWPAWAQTLAGVPLAACLAAAFVAAWRSADDRKAALLLLLGGLGFVILDSLWQGGLFFWAAPWASFLALAGLALRRPAAASPGFRKGLLLGGGVLAAALGAWNLGAGIIPQSRLENNTGYKRTMFVRDHTTASSWIVISGLGYANSKVYLPYCAHRSREVLEYYLLGSPKEEALRRFAEFLKGNIDRGIPLYLLSDLVEDQAVLAEIERVWGVSQAEISACFGPGQVLPVAQQDPGFRVFIFMPRDRMDRLFAVLSYTVLTEQDGPRLQEFAALLKRFARDMTPPQRRQAAAVLKESGFGAFLLWEGFSKFMNPESQRRAEQRIKSFQAYQQTSNFHLRLGNIYGFLGLKGEVRREWGEAYRITPDPGLAADIKALGR